MIKEGDIGFVHNGATISKIISWAMGSKWSHSFVVIGEVHGTMMVAETSDFEVTIGSLSRYMDGRPIAIFRKEDLTPDQVAKICKKSLSILGVVYGYSQLISLGIRRLLKKFGIHIKNFFQTGVVCCYVPMFAYEDILGIPPKSIDTEDLYQIIKKSFSLVHTTIEDAND